MKLKMREIGEGDLHERMSWFQNEKVYSYMNLSPDINYDETLDWYSRIKNNNTRKDLVFYDHNQDLVAMTGLTNYSSQDMTIEYYMMVNPNLQGKGYGNLCAQMTLNFGFSNFSLNKIYSYTNGYNDRINHLLGKIGFKQEGILREHKCRNGVLIDRCIYGILKKEWEMESYASHVINE